MAGIAAQTSDTTPAQAAPALKSFAPSRDDVLSTLAYFFGQPVSPEKLKNYDEHRESRSQTLFDVCGVHRFESTCDCRDLMLCFLLCLCTDAMTYHFPDACEPPDFEPSIVFVDIFQCIPLTSEWSELCSQITARTREPHSRSHSNLRTHTRP